MVEIIDDLPIDLCNSNTVNVRYMNTRKHMYLVFNYDNDMLCYDDKQRGIYRSVILSYPETRVLSFAPPKTIPFAYFQKLYPDWIHEMYVNEYIEGHMIQLFYDSRIGDWEISTEKAIGGLGYFPRFHQNNKPARISLNFRTLFNIAMGGTGDMNVSDLSCLEYFSKEMSYTFILKCPASDSSNVELFLISVYQINTRDKNRISYVPNTVYENWSQFANSRGLFEFPKQIGVDNYHELDNYMDNSDSKRVVITNMLTGIRSIITTREYRRIQSTKNTNPRGAYNFICLNRINHLHGYLHHFPKQRKILLPISEQYTMYIEQLYQVYRGYYIKKTTNVIDERYSNIIHEMHKKIYIPSLNSKSRSKLKAKVHVNKHTIREHLNTKDPYELLHLLQM